MSRSRGPSPFDILAGLFPENPGREPAPEVHRSPNGAEPPTSTRPSPPFVAASSKQPKSARNTAMHKSTHPSVKPHGGRAFAYVKPGRLTPKLAETKKQVSAPAPRGPEQLSGAAALRHVLDRVDLAALHGKAQPAIQICSETHDAVTDLVKRGAAIFTQAPDPDLMGYRVGLDFGTSATKVVVCSDAADVDYAMEVPPDLQVEEHGRRQQHLWRTCVWFDDAKQLFRLAPSDTTRPIFGFKTGLIQGDGRRMLSPGISHTAASTAYLALLIAYIIGMDADRLERQGGLKRHYSRFHIGVPVASLEEDERVAGFHRVVQAAFVLAPSADALTLDAVTAALRQELGPTETHAHTPYQLFEELAGVVAGYMLTPERSAGPHIIVDVGAATLDVATFFIPDGENPLEVYESGVELLGAQALDCAMAAQIPASTFGAACQEHTRHILSKTFRTKDYAFLPGPGNPSKPMIYVGGGRKTSLHQSTYEGYAKAFLAPMRSPGVGRWLERNVETDQERLLLAWGLAQDPGADAIPRIRPPSQVVPVLRRTKDWEGRFIGPEAC